MMRVARLAWLLFFLCLGISGCNSAQSQADAEGLSGRMLLWHTWSDSRAEALDEIIAKFHDIHPQIKIQEQKVDTRDELRRQFEAAVNAGLGPDLIIAPSTWVRTLADQGAINDIGGQLPSDFFDQYLSSAVEMISYDDQYYAIPESLNTMALYYNKQLVDTPAATVDELLDQAARGNRVLMHTDFFDSFWGVQAFGGRLFDEEGQAILDRGGFANWLAWLKTARDAPGMILDDNREALRNRFIDGDAAYYIADATYRPLIVGALGEDVVGVAPLPSGPNGSAGPFLSTDAFMFSSVSSDNQRKLALEFAKFATNAEQSSTLMRKGNGIPANKDVRINPRLYPNTASFATQARSAVPVSNSPRMDAVWEQAGQAQNRVLQGILAPVEAATSATAAINEANGVEVVVAAESNCSGLGTVRLVHQLHGAAAETLNEIIRRFKSVCPLIIIQSEQEDLEKVRERWAGEVSASALPDVVLAPQSWLLDTLQTDGEPLKDITAVFSPEVLQQYRPSAVNGMRIQNKLYGLPESIQVHALYYNEQLVNEPALNVDTLRIQAANGVPILLDTRFSWALWGIGAFGGELFNNELRVILDQGGFEEWLTWLRDSRDRHGIELSNDEETIRTRFTSGESAYYVGDSNELADLQQALGVENLGVTLLPAGPAGDAKPLLLSSGYYFNGMLSDAQFDLALPFVQFATNLENQELVATMANRVPANATLDLSSKPLIRVFAEQAETALAIPNMNQIRSIAEYGNKAYEDVLENGADPELAVAEATRLMNQALGIEIPTSAEETRVDVAEDDGSTKADDAQPSGNDPTTGADTTETQLDGQGSIR